MPIMKGVQLEWAKILGGARDKFNPRDGKEWSVDLLFNPSQVKELEKLGFTAKAFLKEGGRYTARRNELKDDGSPNRPIKVISPDGKTPWPQDKLIGNGTIADIKFNLTDPYKHKNETRVKLVLQEVCIRDHKVYEGKGEQFDDTSTTTTNTDEDW